MFTAVSLGVFDRLHEAPAGCGELARDLKCAEHALERLLGYCAAKELIVQDAEGRWSNTPASDRYLRLESPDTLAGYVLCADRMQFRLWAHLEDAIREGTNRWEQEFGRKDGVFDHFFKTERIDTVDGDFFKDTLPEADLYGFGRILHDWSDEQVRFLLKKTHECLPSGGAVIICEHILNERKDGPATALLQSMNMLVVAEGRERSASEYQTLVREAGFSEFHFQVTGGPVDAMLAVK